MKQQPEQLRDAIRAIIREELSPDGTRVIKRDDPNKWQPTPETQPRDDKHRRATDPQEHQSVLKQAHQKGEFKKLIVFRGETGLWEIVPEGDGFAAHQVKLQRSGTSIVPKSPQELEAFERNFGLDRGIDAAHVTIEK